MSLPLLDVSIRICDCCFGSGWNTEIGHEQQPIENIKRRTPMAFDLGKCDECDGSGKIHVLKEK